MRIVPTLLILPLLALAGCSRSSDVYEELPNSSLAGAAREEVPESRMDAPVARPVTIGEDGPRLNACGAWGRVVRTGAKGLKVRAAPFEEAKEIGSLSDGKRVYICTRSLDQKWLGIIVPSDRPYDDLSVPDPNDCGVDEPVDRKQAYAGPCGSGWVSSAAIQTVAG